CKAIVRGANGRAMVDPLVADDEWAANTDLTRVPLERRDALNVKSPEEIRADIATSGFFPEITIDNCRAFVAGGRVVFSLGTEPDVLDWATYTMTAETG